MRMIHSWRKLLALGALSFAALVSSTACSKLRSRAHEILKPQVTWTTAYQQGRSEAETDLGSGRLRYRIYGEPVEWGGPDLYAQHLRNDYNVELVIVAGCLVSDDLINRTRGYNETAVPAIEARYGKGILERVYKKAVDEWKQTHPST